MISMMWDNPNLIKKLEENGVAVMPTDTLYGIVGRAENKNVVEKIYKIRKRTPSKPCIILIGDIKELEKFSIILRDEQKTAIEKYWSFDSARDPQSEPVSIVLPCSDEKFLYLHRGTNTLAFRLPGDKELRDLLTKVGPLIAPSANPEGLAPARTMAEAEGYFGNLVDLYVDGGLMIGKPSRVIKLHNDGSVVVLRA